MEPALRFCTSSDGTQLAYATLGHGRPLLHLPGFSTNVELEWSDAESRAWMERVASGRLLVRCQRRGVGASARDVTDLSLARQVEDVASVLDHAGIEQADIFAAYDATSVAVAYAHEHPDRVRRLVLFAPYACGADIGSAESFDALADLARRNWRVFLRTWADLCFPSGPTERQRWYADLVRRSLEPETAARYIEFMRDVDVRSILTTLETSAIVLHRSGDRYVPASFGRASAAAMKRASFIPLDGDIGIPTIGDASWLSTMLDFLDDGQSSMSAPTHDAHAFRTVLFTDLVGHTEMMQRLGDAKGRDVLREHERITRDMLKEHGGTEVKTMGDGFMASFGSVTKAMDCAIALQRAFNDPSNAQLSTSNLQVRVGLNAGEPIEEDGDLFGSTVILASRVCAQAGPGEIFVPETVRGLLAGKSYVYADRGDTMLKGFEDAIRLYEVRWRD